MRFGMSIIGDIKKDIDRNISQFERSQRDAVKFSGDGMKNGWRRQVAQAGLGEKLPKSIRSKFYANRDDGNPASMVFTKAPKIMRAFDKGINISSRRGKYMAIPTKFAPKKGVSSARGNFRSKVTPQNFPWHKFGKLEFVPEHNGRPAMLVVKNLRQSISKKSGKFIGYRKVSSRYKGTVETVPMFILVPRVKMPDLLSVPELAEQWDKKMMEYLDADLVKSGFIDG